MPAFGGSADAFCTCCDGAGVSGIFRGWKKRRGKHRGKQIAGFVGARFGLSHINASSVGKRFHLPNDQQNLHKKEETMSLSGAKSHHFIMTAILVSALTLCWSAEAGPDAMRDITLKKVRDSAGAWCLVGNPNVTRDMCVLFE